MFNLRSQFNQHKEHTTPPFWESTMLKRDVNLLYPNMVPLSQTITFGFPASLIFSAEYPMTLKCIIHEVSHYNIMFGQIKTSQKI